MAISFQASPGPSLGVEVEMTLIDPISGRLTDAASSVLDGIGPEGTLGPHPKLKHELFECTVEAITGVCSTVDEARSDLEGSITDLRRGLDGTGLSLTCSGTHPFSSWRELSVSPNPRYHRLLDDVGWPARRLAIFGIHYHVGVRSGEKAIAFMNALTDYLPYFLALSASSPYWGGTDTGMASSRTKVFESLPTAGLPPQLHSWPEFQHFMDALITAEAITSVREVWWDIRPHPDFGTVELRMCDAMPTLGEVVAVAAMAQSLVAWFDHLVDRGYTLPMPRDWIVRQNKWLASRYGLEAPLIVDDSGTRRPATELIGELIDELMPVARRLRCATELDRVRAIVEKGPSYRRQRAVVEAGGTLQDVVAQLERELALDQPGA